MAMTDTFRQDLRLSLHSLLRARGFTIAALVMLMLGIGANTAIFSVLRATSLRATPLPDPERLAIVWTTPAGHPDSYEGARIVEYFAWKERTRSFDQIGTMLGWSSTLGAAHDGEPAERINGWRFSAATFRALGVQPQLGRFFTDEDDRLNGTSDVMVISDGLWRTRFAADPHIVGRTVVLDGQTTTIIGVMPANFGVFDTRSDFWLPSPWSRFQLEARSVQRVLTVIGHIKPGVTVESAQADMESISAGFVQEDPGPQKGRGIHVEPLDTALFANVRRILGVLQSAVGFVLLIGCANVAGLLLIRSASRQREMAIRASLGANRFRIIRMFLAESLLLSITGGVLGLALAWIGVRVLAGANPVWLGSIPRVEVDAGVLAFSIAVSVVTGLAFGIIPALTASSSDFVTPLKDGARTGSGRTRSHIQNGLVVAQVMLTLVLLVGAGLLIKSFWRLQQAKLGLDPSQVLTFQTRLPANKYFKQVGIKNGAAQLEISPVPAQTFERVRERLQQIPGVEIVGGTNMPPLAGGWMQAPFRIEGRDISDVPGTDGINASFATAGREPIANYSLVTPGFFRTMRTPILRGREFTERDTRDSLPVAIVNETMARRLWPNDNPLGHRVIVAIVDDDQPREIVGVVADTVASVADRTPAMALYVPHQQESLHSRVPYGQSRVSLFYFLRINRPLDTVVPPIRRAVAEIDSNLPVSQVEMVDDVIARWVEAPRDEMVLVALFGLVALLLAVLGIYAIVAYGVVQRRHEIGVRMALGAGRAGVLGLVMRRSIALTVGGIVLGVGGAMFVTRYLERLLFEITPFDAPTFALVSLLFVVVAGLASYVPARRATKIDPLAVLRYE
jgi:putative ABC transport system permease protein